MPAYGNIFWSIYACSLKSATEFKIKMRMDSLKKCQATILAPEKEYFQNKHSVKFHTKLISAFCS